MMSLNIELIFLDLMQVSSILRESSVPIPTFQATSCVFPIAQDPEQTPYLEFEFQSFK